MERFLVHNWRRWPLLGAVLAATVIGILMNWSIVYASWHWANFTGWPMGKWYVAGSQRIGTSTW